jgi:hypothetical protein
MRFDNVQDMPIHHDAEVTSMEQISQILDYNVNDIKATKLFAQHNRSDLEIRGVLSRQYRKYLMNASEPRLAKEIFASILSKEMDIEEAELREMRSPVPIIDFAECIIPSISFKAPALQALLEFFRYQKVPQTKGFFQDIPLNFPYLELLTPYADPKSIKSYNGNMVMEHLNLVFDGCRYDLGTGGIHGLKSPGIYIAEDDEIIYDVDV